MSQHHLVFRRFPSLVCALLFFACSLLCNQACGQSWAKAKLGDSPRHREYITVTHDGRNVTTYVVYPEVSGKAPVVILIHEIFGLSDWMKLQADELAAKGYIVLAPDLLTGLGPAPKMSMQSVPVLPQSPLIPTCDPVNCGADGKPLVYHPNEEHAHMMDKQMQMGAQGAAAVPANPGGTDAFPDQDGVVRAVMSLRPEQVIADLNAVADYGKSIPSASGKLAVGGFCWGGGKAFDFATRRADLSAVFSFYGPPPAAAAMVKITAPVYGFYAGNDARIGAMIPQAIVDMKAAGKFYEPVTYEGAGHGFMRAGQAPDASPANKKAFDEGFARMVKELGKIK